MGLNELLELNFSDERLMEIGVKLGADVPFFIFKKTALAEGIGDKLSPVEGLPPVWLSPGKPEYPCLNPMGLSKFEVDKKGRYLYTA